ncbi:MAG: helix-turn-helix transcriptional regulator [Hamadaea sp.]|nr:helix-turn-helix transcriptional regulator [Hamadaea sp.]
MADHTAERAVERVITLMRENLDEQLTVDDMARTAMFSKFHFSRMFQRVTGVSPGRFLSALRLEQAKRLLISTSYNVSDISLRVGYTSVGTFSSRFTRSVGLSPTTYRRQRGVTAEIRTGTPGYATGAPPATVSGIIRHAKPSPRRRLIFAGLFRDRLPEGRPVACAVLREPGPFLIEQVPAGMWYLLMHSVPKGAETARNDDLTEVATCGPIAVRPGAAVEGCDALLQPARHLDPPVLLALLDVRTTALEVALEQV